MQLLSRLLLTATTAAAAVVVIPGGAEPKPYTGPAAVVSEDDYFRMSAPFEFFNNSAELILTSLSPSAADLTPETGLQPSVDSFIRGAIQAWGEHLHLVVRPDEVWLTILVQMNFYMIKHAEELRELFVDHEGQEEIFVKDFNWYDILFQFKDEIQKRVKTDWLLDWIIPDFSTTTESDVMTANVLMMGLTQAYFKYVGKQVCGLPSVTLLGEREDWEKLLARLDRLPDFGPDPADYAERLRPVLKRMVATFDAPDAPETRLFWNQIVNARAGVVCGNPPVFISGWITAFYYWNDAGNPFARTKDGNYTSGLQLDGIDYPVLDLDFAPLGYARVPFIMKDYGGRDEFPAYVAAGTLGKQITQGFPEGYEEALERLGDPEEKARAAAGEHATLRPLSGWMLYGPLEHSDTRPRPNIEDTEIADILYYTWRYMPEDVCGVFDQP
ncbi:hypothetical protein VTH82DRAFT_8458 [Thermothelomyces myriococcoides]